MNNKTEADPIVPYMVAVLSGLVILSTVLINVVVVEMIKSQNNPFLGYAPIPDVFNYLRYALFIVAGLLFFLIRLINNKFLSIKYTSESAYRSGSRSSELFSFSRLIIGSVVVYILCAFVATSGLVLFLIQGNSIDFYILFVASLCYFAVFFPRYGKWKAWLAAREKGFAS